MQGKYPHIYNSFDALKGFRELLKEKEKVVVEKPMYFDDYLDELDYKLKSLSIGDLVGIVVYKDKEYILIEGILTDINFNSKYLQIVKDKYYVKDILDIKVS